MVCEELQWHFPVLLLIESSILWFFKALKTIANLVNLKIIKKSDFALPLSPQIKRSLLDLNRYITLCLFPQHTC